MSISLVPRRASNTFTSIGRFVWPYNSKEKWSKHLFSHCADEKTEDQKGLVTSPRLHSEGKAGIQGTDLSGLKACVLSSPALHRGQQQVVWREVLQQGGKKDTAREIGGPQQQFCPYLQFSGRLALHVALKGRLTHGRLTRNGWMNITQQRAGAVTLLCFPPTLML